MVRDALRRLRGQNVWRGNEVHLLRLHQIRLRQESRAGAIGRKEYLLHITADASQLWAEELPSHRSIKVSEFNDSWEAWLHAIVDACRGGDYVHTNSDNAAYRKAFLETAENAEMEGLRK